MSSNKGTQQVLGSAPAASPMGAATAASTGGWS